MLREDLEAGVACNCGALHKIPVEIIAAGDGVIARLPELLSKKLLGKKAFLVADLNTFAAAGLQTVEVLENSGYEIKSRIFPGEPQLKPDERAVQSLIAETEGYEGFLIAVGSGTINDLVRHTANINNLEYISIATAPSMDGYASVISALMINGIKKTYYGKPPTAIIAQADVLAKAPKKMIAAGFGDMLAKIVSLADWKLGIALMGESYCSVAADLSANARDRVMKNAELISKADLSALRLLTEELINSGLAIIIAGNTRPASGGEHHIAHFIEMQLALQGKEEILHGLKAGFGALCSIACYNRLAEFDIENLDNQKLLSDMPDEAQWEKGMQAVFGRIAPEMISESDGIYRDPKETENRLEKIKALWESEIKPIALTVPNLSEVTKLLEGSGFDYSPGALGITPELAESALLFAMEVRPRYSVLRLMSDLGLLREMAIKISTKGF